MKLNGKEYKIPEVTFDTVCQLEEAGISLSDISKPKKKAMSIIRAFVGLATGLDADKASEFIEEHLANGGDFDGIFQEINKAMEESRFFQMMANRAEQRKENRN